MLIWTVQCVWVYSQCMLWPCREMSVANDEEPEAWVLPSQQLPGRPLEPLPCSAQVPSPVPTVSSGVSSQESSSSSIIPTETETTDRALSEGEVLFTYGQTLPAAGNQLWKSEFELFFIHIKLQVWTSSWWRLTSSRCSFSRHCCLLKGKDSICSFVMRSIWKIIGICLAYVPCGTKLYWKQSVRNTKRNMKIWKSTSGSRNFQIY